MTDCTEIFLIVVVPGTRGTDPERPTMFLASDERSVTRDLGEARVWTREQDALVKLDRVAGPSGPRFGDQLMVVKMIIQTVRISHHHLNTRSPTYVPRD